MKRCPKCDSVFEDSNRFCDLDRIPLVEETLVGNLDASKDSRPGQNWKILAIGAMVGLAIGVLLFTIYYALTRPKQHNSSQATANANIEQPPPIALRAEAFPIASPSPDSSPSPSLSPSPSPSPKRSQTVKLSSSPISTGITVKSKVIIRLTNGATIDADEAWKRAQGIWYRQRGVVVLLDPAEVKAIERLAPHASPSPSISVVNKD